MPFTFSTLAIPDVILLYKYTNEYDPKPDAGIRWNDPDIAIPWPVNNPIVSKKDSILPLMIDAELVD